MWVLAYAARWLQVVEETDGLAAHPATTQGEACEEGTAARTHGAGAEAGTQRHRLAGAGKKGESKKVAALRRNLGL